VTYFYADMATENMYARHQTKGHITAVEVDETGYLPIASKSLCNRTVHPAFEVNRAVELGLIESKALTCVQCAKKYLHNTRRV